MCSNPSSLCRSLLGLLPLFKVSRATQERFPPPWHRTFPKHRLSSSRKSSLLLIRNFLCNRHLTFYSFVLLQGLSGVGAGFLQIVSLIIYYVKLFILGSTSRSLWSIKFIPGQVAWGTLFPNITLLVVISELSIYFLVVDFLS